VNVSCPECRSVFRVDPAKIPALGLRARCSVCGGVITIGAGSSIDEEFAPATRQVSAPAIPAPSVPSAAPVMTPASAPRNTPLASAVAPSAPPARPVVERVATQPVTPPVATRPVMPRTTTPPARPVMFPPRPAMGTPSASSMPTSSTGGVRPPAFAPRPTMPPVPPARPTPAMPSAAARPSAAMRPSGAVSQPPIAPPAAARESMATPTRTPINPFLANDPNAKARRLSRALVSDLVTYFPQRRDEGLRDGTLKDLFREEIKKSYEEYVDQVGKDFADSTTHFQDALNDILAGGQQLF
jgi:predicted Zn finger-like uncharacterized protein